MNSKFCFFNEIDAVKSRVALVKTLQDLSQLAHDIKASGTKSTCIKWGVPDVYCVVAGGCKHIFLTKKAFQRFGEISKNVADSFSILED